MNQINAYFPFIFVTLRITLYVASNRLFLLESKVIMRVPFPHHLHWFMSLEKLATCYNFCHPDDRRNLRERQTFPPVTEDSSYPRDDKKYNFYYPTKLFCSHKPQIEAVLGTIAVFVKHDVVRFAVGAFLDAERIAIYCPELADIAIERGIVAEAITGRVGV